MKAFAFSSCIVALLAIAPSSARSDSMTWLIMKTFPQNAQVAFFSQTRPGIHWPAGGAFNLNTNKIQTIPLTCEADEKVCYGAWIAGSSDKSWGMGLGGTHGCANCCGTCGIERSVRLDDGTAAPAVSNRAVTAFKWTYNAEPSPGTRSWYRDDANRWHERYPDGHEAKVFDMVSSGSANGCAGSVVRGSAEPDFQVFIPDVGCSQMTALFRRGEASWNTMGRMFDVN